MSHINNSDQESPFEVVTPISTPKPKRVAKGTPKATPKAAGDGNGAGNDHSENISLAEGRLLIEMLSAVCENSTGTKFNWAAISEKLGLPSAGATWVPPLFHLILPVQYLPRVKLLIPSFLPVRSAPSVS